VTFSVSTERFASVPAQHRPGEEKLHEAVQAWFRPLSSCHDAERTKAIDDLAVRSNGMNTNDRVKQG